MIPLLARIWMDMADYQNELLTDCLLSQMIPVRSFHSVSGRLHMVAGDLIWLVNNRRMAAVNWDPRTSSFARPQKQSKLWKQRKWSINIAYMYMLISHWIPLISEVSSSKWFSGHRTLDVPAWTSTKVLVSLWTAFWSALIFLPPLGPRYRDQMSFFLFQQRGGIWWNRDINRMINSWGGKKFAMLRPLLCQ